MRVCRVHSWHKMMPSMLAGPLVRSKLALGGHSPPEPNLKMWFVLPCFVCVHVGGCHAHTGRRRVWVSLYLCRIRVGVHIAVAHCGEMPKSSEKMVSKTASCFQFSLYRQLYGPSAFHALRVCRCGSRNFGHIIRAVDAARADFEGDAVAYSPVYSFSSSRKINWPR